MKNVLIIESRSDLVSQIYENKDIHIVAVYVESEIKKTYLMAHFPELEVYTSSDLRNWNQTFLSQEDIYEFKSTQLKVKSYINRFYDIESIIDDIYYTALAFWKHLFQNTIDCVILMEQEHGSTIDSIPLDIAKKKRIPTFIFEIIFTNGSLTNILKSIHCYNNSKYINISEIDSLAHNVDLDLFFQKEISNIQSSYGLLKYRVPFNLYVCIQYWIKSIIFSNVNKRILEYKTFERFFRHYWRITSLKKYLLRKDYLNASSTGLVYHDKAFEIYNEIQYMNKIAKKYQVLSLKSITPGVNAILFALHFEPEATIMNRTTYNNQIYNLRMLSSTLPKGWRIYVKEHPDQFNLFRIDYISNAKYAHKYRNSDYYREIINIPNVYLLDYTLSSHELLKMPEIKAIATINGTISIEGMNSKKHVILFCSESMPYQDVNSLHRIHSILDLKEAMCEITTEKVPDYSDYKTEISKYMIQGKLTWGQDTDKSHSGDFKLDISNEAIWNLILNSRKHAELE